MKYFAMIIFLTFVAFSPFAAQDIQVNRQNKTIAVTADESVTSDAEVATIEIGYHNYAATQDQAFADNVRVANGISTSLLGAHIPKSNIETGKLSLGRAQPNNTWTLEMKKERQFEAEQSWDVSVSVLQAQSVVDLAVRNGANEIEDVDWNVLDPLALQAKASGAALAKARAIAEQMANGLGTKLGELVYASNRAPIAKAWRGLSTTVNTETATVSDGRPKLTLFPEKVKSDATVYAVFSIE